MTLQAGTPAQNEENKEASKYCMEGYNDELFPSKHTFLHIFTILFENFVCILACFCTFFACILWADVSDSMFLLFATIHIIGCEAQRDH